MFSSGPRARLGLPSPVQRIIQRGDPFFVALSLRGSLIARGGFVIADAAELPTGSADYLDHLIKPYFATVVAWYEQVGWGVTGGELQAHVDEAMARSDFDLALNPGHLIHLDEWLHSPIYPGSEIHLRSGMLIQCDIIPVVEAKYRTTNSEDTIMQDVLDIRLKPEVLPFSNMPALLQPFACCTGIVSPGFPYPSLNPGNERRLE